MLIIDAGHGGRDPGAIGKSLKEKEITLKLSKYLETYLKSVGYACEMTRRSDVYCSLEERTGMANKSRATHFISLHVNAAINKNANGIEVFAASPGGEKEILAMKMQKTLAEVTGFTDRGVKFSPFYVLRNTKQTAILIELGFVTNEQNRKKLEQDSFLKMIAKTIGDLYLEHIGYCKSKETWEHIIEGMDPRWRDEILKIKSEGGLRSYIDLLIEKVYHKSRV